MLKLDVCLETVFTNLPVEERIRKVASAGYDRVEMWFHDATFNGSSCAGPAKDFPSINKVLQETGVKVNNLVVNAPDGSLGGSLVKKEDREIYLERLKALIPIAHPIGCTQAITCTGNEVSNLSRNEMRKNIIEILGAAVEVARRSNFTLLLEPLNTCIDHPGYFLNSAKEGAKIVREINNPCLKLLYDLYHMQIMEGNLLDFIEKNMDIIGHFHSAGVPGRHELFNSEINYQFVIKKIEEFGYRGCFGLEYFPALPDHQASLSATKKYLSGVSE